ncbi:hypothetical protein TorRG33x02_203890 [Trema orientale]|uniref:Uncharacterized protein n=1 Tax=Trema orientale TaxID=63057 RepID=A0A2P5EE71_TREOI|nr:hypothetical protein TorRG33x02_203890 [Trema orientale]
MKFRKQRVISTRVFINLDDTKVSTPKWHVQTPRIISHKETRVKFGRSTILVDPCQLFA